MTDDLPPLGRVLRERRAHHGWTLADVATMTGISASTLSKIENGLLSPTYDKILQLARGLGVEIADLFATGEASKPAVVVARRSVSRQHEGQRLDTEFYSYTYLCSDVAHKRIIPIRVEVRATEPEQMGALSSHVGEEFVEVLQGRMRLYSDYYEPIELEPGDSVYLDSTMNHGYLSVGDQPCVIMVMCSSATPNLAQTLREIIKQRILDEQARPDPKA